MDVFNFIPGYTSSIYETGREPALFVLLSFLITFILTRGYTRLARTTGWGSASFGGVHTHHLVFGLVLAFLAAGAEFAFLPEPGLAQLFLATMFGVGAALVLDEFALVFHLDDVYWEKEGRKSVDAVIIGSIFGLLFLLHTTPFGGHSPGLPLKILTLIILIDLFFVIIAALKGKFYLAIFGVFISVLSVTGAIRLAEPNSIWARRYYDENGQKIKKSIARYKAYEKKWRPRKEKLWDIIGGKTEINTKNTKI